MDSAVLKDYALRLQGIIDAAIDGIITIDDRGVVETINKSAATQFGYSPTEVIGNNIKMLMPDPYRKDHDNYMERYQRTKQPRIIGIGREVVGLKKNGEIFPFHLAVSEVILHDRIIYTGIIHDLTEIKNAETELKQLNRNLENLVAERTDELEEVVNKLLSTNKLLKQKEMILQQSLEKEKELNELKSRFVSMASHEFRTPLSTILSSVSLINRYTTTEENEKREKHVIRIKSAVTNLTGILNDFLSLSKIEEGKESVDVKEIAFDRICHTVINEVEGLLKNGQKIEFKDCNLVFNTDGRLLKNILFNLISNAIKYSKENGIIQVFAEKQNDAIVIRIIDDGIGIPTIDQKHMFTRFFRASNVENIQGTGLGLNIVKQYIELLGGHISFVSKEGEGTEFIVTLKN